MTVGPYSPSDLEPLTDIDPDEDLNPPPGYGPAGAPARKLDISEIKGILQREIEDAMGGLGSRISEDRRVSIRMYQGRPIGNEVKDRSQVVLRDVLEVIEWTMPSLMRMFTGGTKIVEYLPISGSPEDLQFAKDATSYVNHIFRNRMDGFKVLHDWMKTALMEKNGITKVYWKERRRPVTQSFTGLTEDELALLLEKEGAEPIAAEERQSEELGVKLFDVTIKFWEIEKGVAVDGVPPEEFLSARRMIHLTDDDIQFCAQRKKLTVSQLVQMGFPFEEVATIPSDDTPEFSQGRTERLSEDETWPTLTTAERTDAASRELWVTDCTIRLDEDGDGYSELRQILTVGEMSMVILDDVEINWQPFCSITPIPMPHKFYGYSLSDMVVDLQIIRSTILRQILDHIYLSNNPRLGVVDGMVEFDDLLTVRPGGLVRQRAPGQIEPIELPRLPPEAFQSLTYLEEVRANRTGIMAHGRELDASAINSTATGLAQLMAEKQQKIELIARIFAETGFRDLFRKILRCAIENATKEEQIQVNGQWMQVDPRKWPQNMDCTVQVGLGAGQAIERIDNLNKIMETQAGVANNGMGHMVTPENVYESASRLAEACGYRTEGLFFSDPANVPPPQPEPNPDMEKLRLEALKAEAEQKTKAQELEIESFKEANLVRHRAEDLAQQERLEMARIESQERIALGQQAATLEAAEINSEGREESESPKAEGEAA